jgi:hypothetical protein
VVEHKPDMDVGRTVRFLATLLNNYVTLTFKEIMIRLILIVVWIFGVILAKGAMSTFFAFIMPFWGWYLAVEFTAKHFGLI